MMNNTMKNMVAELTFTAALPHADPFRVWLKAVFTQPGGKTVTVPAFFAGNGVWRVRYSSGITGNHTFVTDCSEDDTGLHGQSGSIEIREYTGDNELYRRGSVCRRGNDLYLTYRDGTPFYWFGDTWWMALCDRLKFPEDFAELVDDRVVKGFNVIQIVAGLYPDMPPFDERGRNEAGFPWETDFSAINPEYFNMADRRIIYLCENGLTPCIVGSWGFFMKYAGKEAIKRHWDNLIARWAAYPVCWCIAGEANMPFYGDTISKEEALKQSRKDWNDITKHVKEADPFHRLITIHPTQNGHEQIDDESLLDLDMLQTGHNGAVSLVPTLSAEKAAIDRKKLPVINSEVCYEGILNSSYADVQRFIYITSFLLGTCGHTYGATGIFQFNTLEKPYGPSPHGRQWGDTPWREAYRLPGSGHISSCMKFFTQFEWWKFTYRPDWVERPCTLTALDGHFAAGIPGKVRVIYCPTFGGNFWGDARVLNIEKDVTYRAVSFNPVTNKTVDLGTITPDADGSWQAPGIDMFGDCIYALMAC